MEKRKNSFFICIDVLYLQDKKILWDGTRMPRIYADFPHSSVIVKSARIRLIRGIRVPSKAIFFPTKILSLPQ